MKLNTRTKRCPLLFYAAGITAFFTVLLGVIAILTGWDANTNYYLRGSVIPIVAMGFAFLTAILGSIAAFFATDSKNPFERFAKQPIAAVGFFLSGVVMLLSGKGIGYAIVLFLGSVYPLLIACLGVENRSLVPASGLLSVISLLLLNIYYYFDKTVEMNAPIKAYLEMFLICAALWYVEGLRYSLGNPLPRTYLMIGTWTAGSAALAGIPVIFAYFAGNMNRLDYLAGGILALFVLCDVVVKSVAALRRC